LAVIAELLVDDPEPQLRCRREVAERGEHLPRWIGVLSRVEVYRAVRRAYVFGDVDELVIGMRLDGGHELSFAIRIDHNMLSSVADVGVVPDPIDEALARVAETSSDTDVFEIRLADARVWIEDALNKPTLAPETDTWPLYKALVQWLVGRLPEGGEHRSPAGEWEPNEKLCDRFFATSSAAPFTDPAIGSCCWNSSRLVRVTHCGGARRVSNGRSATRPTSRKVFRWRWCWMLPICCARSSHSHTRRAGYERH
jgi:hypothetical protein